MKIRNKMDAPGCAGEASMCHMAGKVMGGGGGLGG